MTRKPTYTKPPNTLKEKMGNGGIPEYILKRAQAHLESNPVDFTPHALKYLDELAEIKTAIENEQGGAQLPMTPLVNIVMQLKSNGSMFHYQLVSMVSDVFLKFLEKTPKPDKDFLQILGTYIKVLGVVLNKRLTGNGGSAGYALTQELYDACQRYYTKHNMTL